MNVNSVWLTYKTRIRKNFNTETFLGNMKNELGVFPSTLKVYTSLIITISPHSNVIAMKCFEEDVKLISDFISSNYNEFRKMRIELSDQDIEEYDDIERVAQTKNIIQEDFTNQPVMVNCGLLQNIKGKIIEVLPEDKYVIEVEINNINVQIKLTKSNIVFLK